jgi:hypothetical protein
MALAQRRVCPFVQANSNPGLIMRQAGMQTPPPLYLRHTSPLYSIWVRGFPQFRYPCPAFDLLYTFTYLLP